MVKTSRAFVIFAAAVFILTLSSCTRKYAITPGSATPTPVTSNSTIYTPVQADNLLSSNLYNFYQSQTGNIFFSPFSIITDGGRPQGRRLPVLVGTSSLELGIDIAPSI